MQIISEERFYCTKCDNLKIVKSNEEFDHWCGDCKEMVNHDYPEQYIVRKLAEILSKGN